MFQFTGFASRPYGFRSGYPCGWVAPFGDPGIKERSPLPPAFRSVPRPSSPLSAKASTRCPYLTLDRYSALSRACARVVLTRPHAPSREDTLPPRQSNQPQQLHCRHRSGPPRSRTHFLFTLSNSTPAPEGTGLRQPDQARRQTGTFPIVAAQQRCRLHRRRSLSPRKRGCRSCRSLAAASVVEVNGIEPMTSCLQSRRSPN